MRAEIGNRPKSHNFSQKKGRDPIDGDARVRILFIRKPDSSGFVGIIIERPRKKIGHDAYSVGIALARARSQARGENLVGPGVSPGPLGQWDLDRDRVRPGERKVRESKTPTNVEGWRDPCSSEYRPV